MDSNTKLTRFHLQALGLSDYLIQQLLKNLDVQSKNCRFHEYAASDVKAAVKQRLTNSRIKPESRIKLQRVLNRLAGKSNVIPVDFLRGLSPEQKLEVLRTRTQELELQEQQLHQETSSLITHAKQVIGHR